MPARSSEGCTRGDAVLASSQGDMVALGASNSVLGGAALGNKGDRFNAWYDGTAYCGGSSLLRWFKLEIVVQQS